MIPKIIIKNESGYPLNIMLTRTGNRYNFQKPLPKISNGTKREILINDNETRIVLSTQ